MAPHMVGCLWHHMWWDAHDTTCSRTPMAPYRVGCPWHQLANTIALLNLGATENFINLQYAKYSQLPIKVLKEPQRLFNMDGTQNKAGDLKYYTDLHMRMGTTQ